jgi:predicted DNA-binding WGR domain protein
VNSRDIGTVLAAALATVLRRRDTSRRMARYYRLSVQWTLPLGEDGSCDLVREWGRIGKAGMVRTDPYLDITTAAHAASLLEIAKLRKGHR